MSAPLIKLDFQELAPRFQAHGFEAIGAVDYVAALPIYREHAAKYKDWILAKKHGEMAYLERGLDRRLDPTLVFPAVNSVITVALPYSPHPVEQNGLRYARYLNGADYHDVLKRKLESVMTELQNEKRLPQNFDYKICVDTSAVLERTWALLCGLGWIGKNTLLIHPQLGSYLFLAAIFTNAEFGLEPQILKDYCGECSRCIRACPTEALQSHDFDSKICISYLTLEKRGAWPTSYNTSGFLAGCDLCQDVCPYNSKALKTRPKEQLSPHLLLNVEALRNETQEEYKARVKGTALSRVKHEDFKRNLEASVKSL